MAVNVDHVLIIKRRVNVSTQTVAMSLLIENVCHVVPTKGVNVKKADVHS